MKKERGHAYTLFGHPTFTHQIAILWEASVLQEAECNPSRVALKKDYK
jgi:hypothetical protein